MRIFKYIRFVILAFAFSLCFSCVKPRYAACTTDHSIVYRMNGVTAVRLVSQDPPMYQLEYLDGTIKDFAGVCWIPVY